MILLKVILALIGAASLFYNWSAIHKIDDLRSDIGRINRKRAELEKENKRLKKYEKAAFPSASFDGKD